MIEKENTETMVFYIDKKECLLAYCPDCRKILYHGQDPTQTQQRVLKSQIYDHLDSFTEEHAVDIIHPRRKTLQVEDAGDYIAPKTVLDVEMVARGHA